MRSLRKGFAKGAKRPLLMDWSSDMIGWQPIETAPKNITVLVWNDDFVSMAIFNRVMGRWVDYCDNPSFCDGEYLTHWMPLPDPPK